MVILYCIISFLFGALVTSISYKLQINRLIKKGYLTISKRCWEIYMLTSWF